MRKTTRLFLTKTRTALNDISGGVSRCSRCGNCLQACPLYRLSPVEINAPRGRQQLMRFMQEGKLKPSEPALQRSFYACTLCGRCTQFCAASLPTAHEILKSLRRFSSRRLPFLLQHFLALRATHPRLFKAGVRAGLLLRPWWKTFSFLPGLKWLYPLAERIQKRPVSLANALKKAGIKPQTPSPSVIYLPSLEAEFLQPQIALSAFKCLARTQQVTVWFNTACGLFDYVYADVRQSKRLLRQLARKHQQLAQGSLPLVTDSLDVYHFLKQAPQLFASQKRWARELENLAKQVHFITDFFPEKFAVPPQTAVPVTLNMGSVFLRESEPVCQNISLFKTLFKQNFVECEYTDFDIPALGYAFSAGNQNDLILFEIVKQTAQKQVKTVFTFSGLSALELNSALRRFYPSAKAQHVVHIADQNDECFRSPKP